MLSGKRKGSVGVVAARQSRVDCLHSGYMDAFVMCRDNFHAIDTIEVNFLTLRSN